MREITSFQLKMEMVYLLMMMAESIKEILAKIFFLEMEILNGRMELIIKGCGNKENRMDKGFILIKREKK
jgi:hypothetical protein